MSSKCTYIAAPSNLSWQMKTSSRTPTVGAATRPLCRDAGRWSRNGHGTRRLQLGHQLKPQPLRTTEFVPAIADSPETGAKQTPVQGYGAPAVALHRISRALLGARFSPPTQRRAEVARRVRPCALPSSAEKPMAACACHVTICRGLAQQRARDPFPRTACPHASLLGEAPGEAPHGETLLVRSPSSSLASPTTSRAWGWASENKITLRSEARRNRLLLALFCMAC